MELGGDNRSALLRHDDDAPPPRWQFWLCGRTDTALHIDALRAVRVNLAFELLGAAALAWTLCTERLHWTDVWDGVDLLLALPTLFALLAYRADPPVGLARWCCVLCAAYTVSVAFDLVWLCLGRWRAVPSRSMTALTDAGSLWMWMQCVYYNRELALALARWQAPIAFVTVSAGDQIEARLPQRQ